MAQTSPLAAALTVKDLQGGVVGQTGVVWTIAPDCTYSIARQIGPNIAAPHKHGRLTDEQQHRLLALLNRMPARRGKRGAAPQPNARQITLSHGQNHTALSLPPPGVEPNAAAADDPAKGLLDLVDALRDMAGT